MQKTNELYTAQQLRSLGINSGEELEKFESWLQRLTVWERLSHNVRCNNLKNVLLSEAYDKAFEGEISHSINLTTFFESDAKANIGLIISQLKYDLSQAGYAVSCGNYFSQTACQSYYTLTISW